MMPYLGIMKKKTASLTGGLLGAAALLAAGVMVAAGSSRPPEDYFLIIGTYAPADSNGIWVYRFSSATGRATLVSAVGGIENPSFVLPSADHRLVFAVSETHNGGGQVYAYRFSQGRLQFLNRVPSGGDDPCNLALDASGRWLFTANYSGGSFACFPVGADGSLGQAALLRRHQGHGVDPKRQDKPHVHCVLPAPDQHTLFVTDLGLDRIYGYRFDAAKGQLSPADPPYTAVAPGSGPRHLAFSPDGRFLYLTHEMGGQLSAFACQGERLTPLQSLSMLPENFHGKVWAADLHLSPDGRFLYASNRDDLNDIVIYRRDPSSGRLTLAGRTSSGGHNPRHFAITPDGRYLLAAHQDGGGIVIFRRDAASGALQDSGERIPVPHAVCVQVIPAP